MPKGIIWVKYHQNLSQTFLTFLTDAIQTLAFPRNHWGKKGQQNKLKIDHSNANFSRQIRSFTRR